MVSFQIEKVTKFFSDRKHGSKHKALTAAIDFRDQFIKSDKYRPFVRRPNNTGTEGVNFRIRSSHGKMIEEYYTRIPDKDGKPRFRIFSVKKYGREEAFRLCCLARQFFYRGISE